MQELIWETSVDLRAEGVLYDQREDEVEERHFTCYDSIHLLQSCRQHVTGIRHHLHYLPH